MKKILTIIGARPQIIKAAALSRAIKNDYSHLITEIIVHTGQHYDDNMSNVFFEELNIPRPNYNLNIGSGSHGVQTAKMIEGIEDILLNEKPDFLVIYGDTNSTLAGAIAASKIHVPIVHIEAGLRSYNKSMPEEINRIIADHVSTFLFSPTLTGLKNLEREGFQLNAKPPFSFDKPGVFNVGDVMYDNSLYFAEIAAQKSDILTKYSLIENEYILTTIHRNNNTDDATRLKAIFEFLLEVSEYSKIVLPLHPRTLKQAEKLLDTSLWEAINEKLLILPPVSYLEMIQLEKNARMVITDSGGVQKEAYFFAKPCIIIRSETEWVEIVENGVGILCDAQKEALLKACQHFDLQHKVVFENIYGDGKAANKIIDILIKNTVDRK